MIRNIYMRVMEYKTDCSEHILCLCRRQKSFPEVCRGLGHDTVKLFKFIGRPHSTKNHKEAVRFVKKGTAAYNEGRYDQAVYYFKRAIHEDKQYARAYYYLGNALYRKGQHHEGISAWVTATEVSPRSDCAKLAHEKLNRLKVNRDNVIGMFD